MKVALIGNHGKIQYIEKDKIKIGEWINSPNGAGFIDSINGNFITINKKASGIFTTVEMIQL